MKLSRHSVCVSEPHPKSLGALVLLSKLYQGDELRDYLDFRDEVFDEFLEIHEKFFCHYCGRDDLIRDIPNNRGKQPHNLATIDHVMPVSRGGGRFDKDNCVIACRLCNQRKADKLPEKLEQTG